MLIDNREKDGVAQSLVDGLVFLQSNDINLGSEIKPENAEDLF